MAHPGQGREDQLTPGGSTGSCIATAHRASCLRPPWTHLFTDLPCSFVKTQAQRPSTVGPRASPSHPRSACSCKNEHISPAGPGASPKQLSQAQNFFESWVLSHNHTQRLHAAPRCFRFCFSLDRVLGITSTGADVPPRKTAGSPRRTSGHSSREFENVGPRRSGRRDP